MSYDLMVFDPASAPKSRDSFLAWFKEQTEWSEDHGYRDPAVTTPALQAWYHEMIQFFPPMNGPFATDSDVPGMTEYCVGRSIIYSAFVWPVADEAYSKTRELAVKHRVGFFDVSSRDGEILFPS